MNNITRVPKSRQVIIRAIIYFSLIFPQILHCLQLNFSIHHIDDSDKNTYYKVLLFLLPRIYLSISTASMTEKAAQAIFTHSMPVSASVLNTH